MSELTTEEIAARWCVRLRDPDVSPQTRLEFEQWIAASPLHRAADEAMTRAWDAAGEEAGEADILAMRDAALRFQAPPHHRPRQRMFAAAAVAAFAVGAGLWFALGQPWPQAGPSTAHAVAAGHFQTAVGERSTVRLSDGSVVTLNTASHMQVELSSATREVRLFDGQAIFEVAQDSTRPFVVLAGDRRITALGTAFDVRVDRRRVMVTLVEGKVAVDQLPDARAAGDVTASGVLPAARAELEVGEQLVAPLGGVATVQSTDVERITSWRQGRLIFEADRLADALLEMNRYAGAPIVLDDPTIGELRLSGVFRTGQPVAFASALEQYFPLQVVERSDATVLRWRK